MTQNKLLRIDNVGIVIRDLKAAQTEEYEQTTYADFKKTIMETKKPVFEKQGEVLICYVDILARDVEKISNWLIDMVQKNEIDPTNLNETYNWLEEKFDD